MGERSALLFGATGLIGRELLQILLDSREYTSVTVLLRRTLLLQHPKLQQYQIDFDRLAHHADHFQVDDLFYCLGTTMKKAGSKDAFRRVDLEYPATAARLAHEAGVRRFLLVSSLGADASSIYFYNRVKGEAEAAVRAAGVPAVHIFRPSLLLGVRAESRPAEQLAARLSRFIPWVGPLRPYRPIAGRTVAQAMYQAALGGRTGIHVYQSEEIQRMVQD